VGWRTGKVVAAAVVLLAVLVVAPSASAAKVEVTFWSGANIDSIQLALGVILHDDGKGELLQAKHGKASTVGSFHPSAGELSAIRAAAVAAAKAPTVNINPNIKGGAYSTLTLDQGGATPDVAVDVNNDSPQMAALVAALNKALPQSHQLRAAAPPAAYKAHAAGEPSTAPCPPGQSPTDISKDLHLQQAANAGVVKLTPKGEYAGDSIAVDGNWKSVKAPLNVTVHIELVTPDNQDWASLLQQDLNSKSAAAR